MSARHAAAAALATPTTPPPNVETPMSLSTTQREVVKAYAVYGPMNDTTLVDLMRQRAASGERPPVSDSGIRSRRAELSKPNMERLDEIRLQLVDACERRGESMSAEEADHAARAQLRREGFRSPVWDTGTRERINGRAHTVWGIAR